MQREAESAFGDADVFLEEAVVSPRHIEVQILADGTATSSTSSSATARCSAATRRSSRSPRRPTSTPRCASGCAPHAVAFARAIGYVNAGTVEFLLAADGRYVFIEVNPRIQVEHTVTEEVTGVDLVSCQMRIASGETLSDLGLSRRSASRSAAPPCSAASPPRTRPTSFLPDTGRITTYRSAGGAASGSTAAPSSSGPRSAPTSTRCW